MIKTKLLSSASHAFWEATGCGWAVRKGLLVFIFICAMVMARTAKAQITIDGNPSDWTGKFSDPSIPFKSLIKDSVNANDNIYTGGGSKDDNPISSWAWKIGSVQDKDDIENAGMLLIGHKLYFFADKYAVNGDANAGLWVFKNVVSVNPDGTFSGVHTDGDLFVAMSFVGGGGHPERHIYKWQSGALVEITLTTTAADVASNQSDVYPTPTDWTYKSKDSVANWYQRASFLEGVVNLDSIPGIDLCFTNFIVNTRSAHAVGSTLSDLALGTFATRPIVTVFNDTVCAGQSAVFVAHEIGGLQPISFAWNGSATYVANDSIYTINPATVNTVVTVRAQGSNGCISAPDTALLVVKPSPTITATADRTHCNGATGTAINFTSTPPGATFSWVGTTNVGFGTSGTVNPIPSYTATNTSSVTVTDTVIVTPTAGGCPGRPDTFLVTVYPTPSVVAHGDSTYCDGASAPGINFSGTPAGVSFSWTSSINVGFGTSNTGNIAPYTATNTGTVAVTATVIVTPSANGCTGKADTFLITVNPTPVVNAHADTVYCPGVLASAINFSGNVGGTTFAWTSSANVGFSTSGTGNIPAYLTINGGSTAVVATVTVTPSANGCSGRADTFTVTVNPKPGANPPVDNAVLCAGALQDTIHIASLDPAATTTWNLSVDLGFGTSGTGNLPSFIGSNPGTVAIVATVTVTASSTSGCPSGDTAAFTITINPDAGSNAPVSNIFLCSGAAGDSINIKGLDTVTIFTWTSTTNVGFGMSGSGNIPPFTAITNPGPAAITAMVTVTGASPSGCPGDTTAFTVTIYPNPVVTARDTAICTGSSVDLNLLSDPDGGTWTGTGVSGTTFNGGGGLAPGTYGLNYTFTDGNGCTSSDSAYITINAVPTVVARDTAICSGVVLDLNLISDPDGGTWSGTGVSGTTFNSVGLATGTYGLLYTYTQGICSGSDSAYITINANPVVTARDTAICSGVSFSLNLLSDPDGGTWSGTGVSGTTFSSVGLVPGVYGLLYTYTNGSGCTGTDSAYITVNANPVVSARDTAICSGVSFSLNLLSDPDGGTWAGTGVSGTTFNSSGLATGTYGLLYTYTNGSGCTGSDSAYVTIIANPTVTARDTSICAGVSLNLNLLSDPDGGTWTGTGVSGTTFNSAGLPAGKYGLLYTLSSGGCGGSDSAYITIKPTPDVYAHGDSIYCKGILAPGLTFSGSIPGTTFAWTSSANVGFGPSGSGNIPAYITLNPGSTNLVTTVIVTPSKYGCVGAKDTFLITIKPKPTIPYIHNLTVCSGEPVGLINITGGDLVNTYTWTGTLNVGFGTSGTGNIGPFTAIVNYGPGNKVDTVTVSVTSTAGCPGDTKKFKITVQPKPHVIARDTAVCNGTVLNLAPLGTPAGGNWSGPGVSGSTFNSGSLGTGTYKVFYTVCNGSCTAYDSAYICVTQCCVVYGTYTQGLYSACDYRACDGQGHKKTMVELINWLLCSGGQITVGRPGRSVIVPTWAASILNNVLPSGYGANKLSYGGNVTISNTPGSIFAIKYLSGGKINNILMAQAIVLKLNLRLSPGLCNFPIEYTHGGDSYFQTFNADGHCCTFTCGNTCPKCFCIKKSVAKFLTKGGTHTATVSDLVNLADNLLGGVLIPGTYVSGYAVPSYADVADVIGTIHNAFDSYRTFNGSYGCSAAKAPVASTIGNEVPSLESQTLIYPNPTTGTFTIEVPALDKDANVVVLDINGRSVLSRTLPADPNGQKLQIDMPDVARGLYIIRIESEGKGFSKKLMIE